MSPPETAGATDRYGMAPLIRFTLIALYLALVLPLPLIAPPAALQRLLAIGVLLGLLLVLAITSEQVELSGAGLQVGHPRWCSWLLRRGWSVEWSAITGLTPVATSQGGRVFYVRQASGASYLLPQRIAAFPSFLARFSAATGIDTSAVGRISPPWTYQLLAVLVALLLGAELIGWLWLRICS